MSRFILPSVAAIVFLASCTQQTSTPTVPDGAPVSGSELRALVEGGPYALRIFGGDLAGTTGQTTWNFADGTVSGSFTTAEGESGTFSQPLEVNGNQLCAGEGDTQTCHFIYPFEDGFMEVTGSGTLHAISTPL